MQRAIAAGPGIVVRAFSTRRAAAAMAGYRGPVTERIEEKLRATFNPTHLAIINESHTHAVPKNSETHFNVVVVSDAFANKPVIQRHRLVHAALADELASGVHALSIVAKTPQQWESNSTVVPTPRCMGGSKHDKQ